VCGIINQDCPYGYVLQRTQLVVVPSTGLLLYNNKRSGRVQFSLLHLGNTMGPDLRKDYSPLSTVTTN
jgi:hypothetical protein